MNNFEKITGNQIEFKVQDDSHFYLLCPETTAAICQSKASDFSIIRCNQSFRKTLLNIFDFISFEIYIELIISRNFLLQAICFEFVK